MTLRIRFREPQEKSKYEQQVHHRHHNGRPVRYRAGGGGQGPCHPRNNPGVPPTGDRKRSAAPEDGGRPGPGPGHNARVLCGAGCGQRHLHTRPGQPETGGHCAGPDQRRGWKGLRRVGAASWGAGPVGRRAGNGHRSHKQGSGPGRRLQRHRSPGAAAEASARPNRLPLCSPPATCGWCT